MITCRELIEFLDDYVDENLSEERRREFEEHLAVCPDCVAYIDSYEKTVELTKRAYRQQDELPEDVPDELVRAVIKSVKR